MPSAREREALRAIQHQFSTGGHSAARSFHTGQTRSPNDHRRPARPTVTLVMTALVVLMLVGPNVLTEKEVRALTTPSPRHSRAAPGTLAELADREFTGCHILWLPVTPETVPGKGFVSVPSQRRHTSSTAA